MDGQIPQLIPPYRECQGSWRPDFLVEEDRSGERFRITEINARFSFNAYMLSAHGQQTLQDIGISDRNNGLKGATDPQMVSFEQGNLSLLLLALLSVSIADQQTAFRGLTGPLPTRGPLAPPQG